MRWKGRTWSLILAAAALGRGWSYHARPPRESVTTTLIEGTVPYSAWAIALATAATLIVAGVFTRHLWMTFTGHVIATACYSTFALSILTSAVVYGQAWSGFSALTVVTLIHIERTLSAGQHLGRQ